MFVVDVVVVVELFVDLKECVEYVMLIDFGCNDVGCVVVIGSVKVIECMVIECYLYVMYIVLNVEGKIVFGFDVVDVLKVSFFVGIVIGVLKVCVMQIIDEFELVKCGVYSGVVGYFGFNGDMDVVIVICIVVFKDCRFYVQVVVGIVVDFDLCLEWFEIQYKVCVLLCVVEIVDVI